MVPNCICAFAVEPSLDALINAPYLPVPELLLVKKSILALESPAVVGFHSVINGFSVPALAALTKFATESLFA